jgi:hypothetical protein
MTVMSKKLSIRKLIKFSKMELEVSIIILIRMTFSITKPSSQHYQTYSA